MPLSELLSAQGIKTTRRRRLVRVSPRVVFGTFEAVQQVLAACGWQINPAFVERINLTIRQHVAAVGRRVSTLCKGEDGMRQQLARLLQLLLAPGERTRAVATAPADQRDGLRHAMAAADTSDGRGADGSGVDPPGGVALSRAAVAAASKGVSQPDGGKQPERGPEQATCVHAAGVEGVTRGERAAGRP